MTLSYMQQLVLSWQQKQMLRQWVRMKLLLLVVLADLAALQHCCWDWIWRQMLACTVQATFSE
jgi:hypothetical protein